MKGHLLLVLSTISAIGLITMALMPRSTATAGTNAGATSRVSVGPDSVQGNNRSQEPSISANGRFVAFESDASNLVVGDTNGVTDIFVHDRQTGTTSRVSIKTGGTQGNGNSYAPSISADGRYVAFESDASNLVDNDTNGLSDIFVHDRQTGTTSRVSVGPGGAEADGESALSSISADGLFVVFISDATNLVADDTNDVYDVFVRDLNGGTTGRVSVASNGSEGDAESWAPAISADGRFVAFESAAGNLVNGDTNDAWDIFVRDRVSGTTSRISIRTGGEQGGADSFSPAISADGRYMAFESDAVNLVPGDTNQDTDIFVHDRQAETTARVSVGPGGAQATGDSFGPAISGDGRYIAFISEAGNLVPGDNNNYEDIFVHDRQTGTTGRVSVNSSGAQADDNSHASDISGDGRLVAFGSDATNLVSGDTNGVTDVFVHAWTELVPPTTVPPTVPPPPTPVVPTYWLYLPVSMK